MLKKTGLYTKDSTVRVQNTAGSARTWKRTALVNDGERIYETAAEQDSFGLRVTDDGLNLNGEVLAAGDRLDEIKVDGSGVSYGSTVIANSENCIRITKDDYCKLRRGKPVPGYGRYRPENVYYLTDDIASRRPIPFDRETVAGHEDIIWNSFTGELADNPLTDATMLSVKTPTLDLRHYDAVLVEGDRLELEYFVDTHDYDSVYRGLIDDTFTVIVSGPDGELLRRTTYAGQFKVSVDVGSQVGKSWFSIRCIDKSGRGSVETFGDYRIIPSAAPNIKELDSAGMSEYGLTVGNAVGYQAAYLNRRNFAAMCHTLKGQGYEGVKLYNGNPDLDLGNLDGAGNPTLEFDNRWNVGENGEYVAAGNTYYLLHYDADTDSVSVYDAEQEGFVPLLPEGNPLDSMTDKQRTLAVKTEYVIDKCEDSIIVPGKTFVLDGREVVVGESVAVGSVTRAVSDAFEWVRWDGASIYRDASGKVLVHWNTEETDAEVTAPNTNEDQRVLRVRSLNRIVSNLYTKAFNGTFPEGSGYYYCAWYNGRGKDGLTTYGYDQLGDYELALPDDFTIDLNGVTLKNVGNVDHKGSSRLLYLAGSDNVCVKNGKLVGVYNHETIKRAFLTHCMIGNTVWEKAGGLVSFDGSYGIHLENLIIDGSHGYELYSNAAGNGSLNYSGSHKSLLYGSDDATIAQHLSPVGVNETAIVTGDDGSSLITALHPDYDASKNQQVCLLTSDMCSCDDLSLSVSSKVTDPDNTASKDFLVDEIYIGTMDKVRYGGAYPYYFVNFYNGDSLVKTVKTEPWLAVKIPSGATGFNVTAYGVCEVDNSGGIHVLGRDGGVKYVSDRFYFTSTRYYTLCGHSDRPTKNVVIRNCTVRNTRTIAMGDPQINALVENTVFDNISNTQKCFKLTNMIMDIEETRGFNNIICFRGCEVKTHQVSNLYSGTESAIGAGFARHLQIVGCKNIGISTCGSGCYFADSQFLKFVLFKLGGHNMNCRNIIRRCAIAGTTAIGWSMTHTESYDDRTRYMSCYEQVCQEESVEDCLLGGLTRQNQVTGYNHCTLVGRRYKIDDGSSSVIHDQYNE